MQPCSPRVPAVAALLFASGLGSVAMGQTVVFQSSSDNGYFTPFTSSSSPNLRYGDSGWIGNGSSAPVGLRDITLGLAALGNFNAGGSLGGTVDITFTFNDGDPSGLVFGPGSTLLAVTIPNVHIPQSDGITPAYFDLTIPLPGVVTSGGFNNIGWSVGVANMNYTGSLGFQCSTAFGQTAGFYTNNASFFNGSNWSLFSFGPDFNTGVANFTALVTVPAPASAAMLGLAGLAMTRRRR